MTTTEHIIDLEALLAPIGGSDPAGPDVRYLPVFDAVKTARRDAEAAATRDGGQGAAEMAAWAATADRATELLRGHAKDLQVSLWLLESLSRLEGFRGAATGLALVRGLADTYWESLHPRLDPEDPEPLGFRASLMQWIDEKLPSILKSVPLTGPPAGYTLLHYEATLADANKKRALLEDGWPSSEQIDQAFQATTLAQLDDTLRAILACREEVEALERVTDVRLVERRATASGGERVELLVSFRALRESLETARWLLDRAAAKKRPAGAATASPDARHAAADQPANASTFVTPSSSGPDDVDGAARARELVRGNQLEGLRLLQERVAEAASGRERFLRQLQFAEICLEAGIHAVAFPMFDELAKTIETRQLEAWEHRDVLVRAWRGLSACCDRLKALHPDLEARQQDANGHVERLIG